MWSVVERFGINPACGASTSNAREGTAEEDPNEELAWDGEE